MLESCDLCRVSCDFCVQCVMNPDTGEPQDELLPEAKTLIAKLGSNCTTISEIVSSKDEKVYSEITAGLERANKHAVSHAQRVRSSSCPLQLAIVILIFLLLTGSKVHHSREGLLHAGR